MSNCGAQSVHINPVWESFADSTEWYLKTVKLRHTAYETRSFGIQGRSLGTHVWTRQKLIYLTATSFLVLWTFNINKKAVLLNFKRKGFFLPGRRQQKPRTDFPPGQQLKSALCAVHKQSVGLTLVTIIFNKLLHTYSPFTPVTLVEYGIKSRVLLLA